MDIKNLEAFLTLAGSLNFTKSAEQMFLSQSAFSRQITRLEKELGCQLFHRDRRNVKLTGFGQDFLEYAEKIVSEYNRCVFKFKQVKESDISRLRLGIQNDLIDELFPDIIQAFREEHPDVAIYYSDKSMSNLINALLQDEIDCAYTLCHDSGNILDISSFAVAHCPVYAALSEKHPYANRESLKMEDLVQDEFIFILPDTYNLGVIHVNYLCRVAGFTPKIAAVVTSINSLLMLVNSNIGVAVIADTAKMIAPPGVKFIRIETEERPPIVAEKAILWKTENTNPVIERFLLSAKKILDQKINLSNEFINL
ncbi:LysR family transcriptional regulator [Sinanaerobacter chloroacetimidivorans]|uniref:LysR family transcriptional regulator n=1 Tax=Sinanaerobacter chloroacetimidivorans TaxID=2818044 RepID=A0A8J7W2N4_9FIRM|nr:LysR family transcriptional regulator [Sinanaerobacter chloroacetimidivorans]MBR0597770.1 LysR family transcriptional regulator [Sinanaerobacter chloroacetimidivorans]